MKLLFWATLAALVWTHLAYPIVAAVWARVAGRRVRRGPELPSVSVIVAAYNEESVIEQRLENLLAPCRLTFTRVRAARRAGNNRSGRTMPFVVSREPPPCA